MPIELRELPPFPTPVGYLWAWWSELQVSQELIIPYNEIRAWCELTGASPTPGEVLFIRDLSRLFISILNKP